MNENQFLANPRATGARFTATRYSFIALHLIRMHHICKSSLPLFMLPSFACDLYPSFLSFLSCPFYCVSWPFYHRRRSRLHLLLPCARLPASFPFSPSWPAFSLCVGRQSCPPPFSPQTSQIQTCFLRCFCCLLEMPQQWLEIW